MDRGTARPEIRAHHTHSVKITGNVGDIEAKKT